MDFKKYIDKYKEEALNTLVDILKMDTVLDEYKENDNAPFGEGNLECLNYMLNKASNDNFETKNVDNYAGHIHLGTKGDLIGILGHLDVVPAVGVWDSNPFEPVIKDGKLIARGTLDDKGPVVAAYYALKIIKDMNLDMKNQIRIILGCDEETGSRCVKRYFTKEPKPAYGFSPDADFPVIYGEKGILTMDLESNTKLDNIKSIKCGTRYNIVCDEAICEFDNIDASLFNKFLLDTNNKGSINGNTITILGRSAHAMSPSLGVNAIYILMQFINEYYPNSLSKFIIDTCDTDGTKMGINYYDNDMKDLTINLGICNYDGNAIKLGYNMRLPKDDILDSIISAFNKYSYKVTTKYSKSHYVDPNSDFVKTLMSVYQETTNDYESQAFTIGGGTYAREIENAVAFGPMFKDREDVVHQPNEYIFIEDFYAWIEIYVKTIYKLVM